MISIIIPFKSWLPYLKDCLDSLVDSKYKDFEIILVKDHVTDEEGFTVLLEKYKGVLPIVLLELPEEKTGVAAARNAGLDNARGEYVYFLDSDDYLLNDTLAVLLAGTNGEDIIYGRKKSTWVKRDKFLEDLEKARLTEEHPEEELKDDTSNSDNDDEDYEYSGDEQSDKKLKKLLAKHSGINRIYDYVDEKNRGENAEEYDAVEIEKKILLRKKADLAYIELFAAKKGVTNISILHMLIKRELIENNEIRFDERFSFYSDVTFVARVLTLAETFCQRNKSLYIKRKHNDPIHNPSVTQQPGARYPEFIKVYRATNEIFKVNETLRFYLWQKFINYYERYFSHRMFKGPEDPWTTTYFAQMRSEALKMSMEFINLQKGYKKRCFMALRKGNLPLVKFLDKSHKKKGKLLSTLTKTKARRKALYNRIFRTMKLKENAVIFESFFGKYYSDSPRSIYEYMQKTFGPQFEYIFVLDSRKVKPEGKCKIVKRNSLRYYYYLARCKYLIFNVRSPKWFIKRKGQVFVETWHGTPLKRLVFDQEEVTSSDPHYKEEFYQQVKIWDYLVSPNAFSTETFRRCFLFNKTMLETGYPRNDILHQDNIQSKNEEMRRQLGLPLDKKIILYAPTWRDDEYYSGGKYKFNLELNLYQMRAMLGEEYIVLLRTHYYIADSIDISGLEDFAYNFSKYEDISHLYLVSDILITDYSSVFFDFGGLKRPIIFFTYDLEKYRDMLRGFYLDIEKDVPGPLTFTTEEVIDKIININQVTEEYKEKYDKFYKTFCEWEDGHASEKIVKEVFAGHFVKI